MPVRQRGSTYQADLRFMGERIRHGFTTPQAAHLWLHNAEAEVIAGRRPAPPPEAMQSFTLQEVQDRVTREEWSKCKAGRQLSYNGQVVVSLLGPARQLRSVTYADIEGLVKTLLDRGESNGTVNRKLAALSKLFTYAKKHDQSINKPSFPRLREAPPRQRTLSDAEFAKLKAWDGWREVDLNVLTFLWYTGARISEPLREGCMRVNDAGHCTFTDTKNGDDRTIPLHPEALSAYQRGLDTNPWTFRHRFREAVTELKLGDDVVVHTLRHSCASRLARKQMNAFLIQKWMGHKSTVTTQRYVKAAPTDLNALMDAL